MVNLSACSTLFCDGLEKMNVPDSRVFRLMMTFYIMMQEAEMGKCA